MSKSSPKGADINYSHKKAVPKHSHIFQAFRGKKLCEEHSLAKNK
jgi:hypothetical protein